MIGDDNSDCFRGTWNTDYTVKTVTKATASVINNNCDLVFFAVAPSSNQDSRAGVYYSNGKVGIITATENNFKPSIDKPIPLLVYYDYRDSSIGPSYYFWYRNLSVLTSSNLSVLNGTYNFTFDFDYLGKHYSIKKKLIYSYQFTGTVKLLANNNISANLTVKRIENLNYYIFLPRDGVVNHCGKTISKDIQFSLSPYIEAGLIKSITVTSRFDDVGYASINGISVGSCTDSGCNISEITIDVSNLKSNNKLYMSASDIRFFDCSFINNATDAKVQITINYK